MTSPATSTQDVGSWLDRLAATCGRREALRWVPFDGPGRSWSYDQLVAGATAVAAGLQTRGVRPGDRVVLLSDNSPDVVLGWLGTVLAGATAVSLNARLSAEELSHVAGHADPVGAFVSAGHADLLGAAMPGLRWAVVGDGTGTMDSVGEKTHSRNAFQRPDADPARAAGVQYTSGTTARPKGVVWSHANILWAGRVGAAHQVLRADDVNLVHLPLFHTNALSYSLLPTLWAGGTVVLTPRFSASRFWDVAVRERCTWTAVVSFCVRALAERPAPPGHWFRGWGHSWCIPPGEGPGGVGALGWFGMTETVSHPVVGDPRIDPEGSMGRPAAEYGVRVVDESGVPVGAGGTGRLEVRGVPGVSLFAGYLGDAAATEAAFTPDGWFRTGDRVRVLDGGALAFVEREGDVLKVGGENVGAAEVERVVLGVPGVREVAVIGRPDPMLGEVPVAFVVGAPEVVGSGEEGLVAAVEERCRAELADFKRPREVRVVPDLPRSTLEKVARGMLRARLDEAPR